MKKFTLLTLLAIGFISAEAQVKKGDVLLGANISAAQNRSHFNNPLNQDVKQEGISTRLSLGVARQDNRVVGFGLSYSTSTQKQSTNKNNSTLYGADVFLRRYYPIGKGFSLFAEGDAGYSYSRYRTVTPLFVTKNHGYTVAASIEPGLAYNLTNRFQLEVVLPDLVNAYYTHSSYKDNNPQNASTNTLFGISSSLGTTLPLAVGFKLIL